MACASTGLLRSDDERIGVGEQEVRQIVDVDVERRGQHLAR